MADDLQKLMQDLDGFAGLLANQADLNKVGAGAHRLIQQRTRRGVDYLGNPFEAYSEGWAKTRAAKGLPTDTVNLQFTLYGGMMESMTWDATPQLDGVELYFNKDEKAKLAYYHTEAGAGKSKVKREFFALNDEDADKLAGLVADQIFEQLKLQDLA